MLSRTFWQEEIRSYPRGGPSSALWVVRREGTAGHPTLRLLFAHGWATGPATVAPSTPDVARSEQPAPPPLNCLQRVIRTGQSEELLADNLCAASGLDGQTGAGTPPASTTGAGVALSRRLWAVPLRCDGEVVGAMAIWYGECDPWGEALRLWGARFAGRIGPMMADLVPWSGADPGYGMVPQPAVEQPTLFVLPAQAPPAGRMRRDACSPRVPLPFPIFLPSIPGAVGVSREMHRCSELVQKAADAGVNVLLQGESGTGKEIVARAIHLNSDRNRGPLLGQNCAALPETLFESELFGHKSGAFTGATADKVGLLEAASGGTFFLDEIGDMPQTLQIKLLRVMQERQVRRVGELKNRPVDIRFIAATHKDLEQEVKAGRFRLDLYYRLKVVKIAIPPLRQRPEDISHLLAFFLRRHGVDRGGRLTISEPALAALQSYRWPGNVRELENEVCRLLAFHPGQPHIELDQLSDDVQAATGDRVDPADLATLRKLDEASQLLERYLIRKAIAAAGGRKAAAARRLGLSRQGLYKKIQRYGMVDLIAALPRRLDAATG